jgi:dethiobiotin synthetase
LRGCFITGTDTGVGKTVLAAAIVARLRASGVAAKGLKPIITGLDQALDGGWPHDHELLASVSGSAPEDVALIRFGPAVSPHLAARLASRPIEIARLRRLVREATSGSEVAVVEGVGGLLVPLADGYAVRDLARDLRLPLVVAARPGLGTINHTLLTLEAARACGLPVSGVVLTPWPVAPGAIERSNRDTIERLGSVPVATLARVASPEPELLAAAADLLPLDDWLR